ncbi:MAG: NCS2 family permease, partial [Psychrobacillus sp.]
SFLTIIMMPLTSSVVIGIGLGFVLYPICLVAQKRSKEVHPIMYLLCLLFILYFAFIV